MDIASGLSSLKAALDLIGAVSDTGKRVSVNEAKVALLADLTTAHSALEAAISEIANLKEEVRGLQRQLEAKREWEAERAKYELADAGLGSLAYRRKAGEQGGDPMHWLCPNCIEQSIKSILQPVGAGYAKRGIRCQACGLTLATSRIPIG